MGAALRHRMNNPFETISPDALVFVAGGLNIGALAQGIGSLFGAKGEAVGQAVGNIAQNVQGILQMFRGGGQPQAGEP
jgi:hypothetical protein